MTAAIYKKITPESTNITSITMENVRRERTRYQLPPETMENSKVGYWNRLRIWVPGEAMDLKLQIAAKAH